MGCNSHFCLAIIWGPHPGGFPGGSDGKESACSAGDLGLIPGLGRSPGEENGYILQCSCLLNSMDRGAWWATVHGISESYTTEQLTHTHIYPRGYQARLSEHKASFVRFCSYSVSSRTTVLRHQISRYAERWKKLNNSLDLRNPIFHSKQNFIHLRSGSTGPVHSNPIQSNPRQSLVFKLDPVQLQLITTNNSHGTLD